MGKVSSDGMGQIWQIIPNSIAVAMSNLETAGILLCLHPTWAVEAMAFSWSSKLGYPCNYGDLLAKKNLEVHKQNMKNSWNIAAHIFDTGYPLVN